MEKRASDLTKHQNELKSKYQHWIKKSKTKYRLKINMTAIFSYTIRLR